MKAAGFVFLLFSFFELDATCFPRTVSVCQTKHAHSARNAVFFPQNVNSVVAFVILIDIVLICFCAS